MSTDIMLRDRNYDAADDIDIDHPVRTRIDRESTRKPQTLEDELRVAVQPLVQEEQIKRFPNRLLIQPPPYWKLWRFFRNAVGADTAVALGMLSIPVLRGIGMDDNAAAWGSLLGLGAGAGYLAHLKLRRSSAIRKMNERFEQRVRDHLSGKIHDLIRQNPDATVGSDPILKEIFYDIDPNTRLRDISEEEFDSRVASAAVYGRELALGTIRGVLQRAYKEHKSLSPPAQPYDKFPFGDINKPSDLAKYLPLILASRFIPSLVAPR